MMRLHVKQLFRPLIARLWIKEVRGLENVPASGALVVVNHHSVLDPLLLCAALPRLVCFMSVPRGHKHGVLSRFFYHCGCSDAMERLLQENKFCCVFSSSGEVQRELARAALAAKAPLLPVAIIGASDLWPEYRALPRFHKIVSILIGSPLFLREYYGREESDDVLEEVGDIAWRAAGTVCEEYYSAAGLCQKSFFDPNRYIYPL